MMSMRSTSTNKNTIAIDLIRRNNETSFPVTPATQSLVNQLCRAVSGGFKLGKFPSPDDDSDVRGSFICSELARLKNALPTKTFSHPAFRPCVEPDTSEVLRLITVHTGFQSLLASAVTKFLTDANQYEENRKKSARVQLGNDGVPPDEIDEFVKDSIKVRQFVSERRNQLILKLKEAKRKQVADDAFNMLTEKEQALLLKQSHWFGGDAITDDGYLPNDNAVSYVILLTEIIQLVFETNPTHDGDLTKAVSAFFQICSNALKSESNSRAWKTLQRTPSCTVEGFNVGAAVSQYVSDPERTKRSKDSGLTGKLNANTQRGVRRLYRLCSTAGTGEGQYSIMNLSPDQMVPALMQLWHQEQIVASAIDDATNIAKGVAGLSDAESMAWLLLVGRQSIWECATGRNDLSVPALVGPLVSIDVSAFGKLPPKPWSITDDL